MEQNWEYFFKKMIPWRIEKTEKQLSILTKQNSISFLKFFLYLS